MVLPLIFTLVLLWHIGQNSHLLLYKTATSNQPILYPFVIREFRACNPISLFSKYSCLAFGISFMEMTLLLSSIHTAQAREVFEFIFSLPLMVVVFIKPYHGYDCLFNCIYIIRGENIVACAVHHTHLPHNLYCRQRPIGYFCFIIKIHTAGNIR